LQTNSKLDLTARAHLEMVEAGFVPDFEKAVKAEAHALLGKPPLAPDNKVKDLRSLLWSSIDNDDSRDLDQIEYVETLANGGFRLMVGIADVDMLAPKGSACDSHALENTTSIYLGIVTYPMLPEELSTNLTSLLADGARMAIVIDMVIDSAGNIKSSDVYRALVQNKAKLAYGFVGEWLENGGTLPAKIADVPGLADQLKIQDDLRKRLSNLRHSHGALRLITTEATTIVDQGQVIDLQIIEPNAARDLIENFMIAANVSMTTYLAAKKLPSLRRIVKTPERWDKIVEVAQDAGGHLPANPDAKALADFLVTQQQVDPVHFPDLSLTIIKLLGSGEYVVQLPGKQDAGHFALAVRGYTHSTAPNRRYPDLITQRLVKAVLNAQATPYSLDELEDLALTCTRKEDAARKVERKMRKVAAAVLLSKHIGEVYDGIVTGVTDGGTYVRLLKPPVEGRIMKGEHGLDVGDKVKVRLVETDIENAYIDFARVH